MTFFLALVALSLVGAFVSGMVGVGGAIVMIPLLLYVPPLLGVGRLEIKTVAAVTMVQVFVAAVTAVIVHRQHGSVRPDLALIGGLAMAAGSLTGAVASKFADDRSLMVVFGLMTLAALSLLFLPAALVRPPLAERAEINRTLALTICLSVGLVAGLVGAGGAFLLVPLLIVVARIPIRVTIGSSLAITAVAATAGVTGKMVTGQVPLLPTMAVILGAVPGARLGALVSRRLTVAYLRRVLFALILTSSARVWWDLLVAGGE